MKPAFYGLAGTPTTGYNAPAERGPGADARPIWEAGSPAHAMPLATPSPETAGTAVTAGTPGIADLNELALPALYERLCQGGLVRRTLEVARDEDLGIPGAGRSARDITSACCIEPGQRGTAEIVARVEGVVSGLAALPLLAEIYAPAAKIRVLGRDGEWASPRTTLATIDGPLPEILALERTALNLIGRLCGVATKTAQFVAAMAAGSRARLYDTRKTTPGLRMLEKYAVRCGGGCSHRLGLHDAVLIKDNHIAGVSVRDLPAFVARAAERARGLTPPAAFIEVEVDTLDQFEAMLTLPPGTVDIVLLDNMTPEVLREAARLRDARSPGLHLEASGGVNLGTIHEISSTGVDRISVGALTHSAVSIDVAMDIAGLARAGASPA